MSDKMYMHLEGGTAKVEGSTSKHSVASASPARIHVRWSRQIGNSQIRMRSTRESFFITINLVYEYVLRQQTKQIIPREGASGPPQKGNQQLRNKERNPATATDSSAPESIGVLVRPIRHTAQMSTNTRFLLLQVKTLPSTNTLKPKHSSLRILVRRRKVYDVKDGHGYLLGLSLIHIWRCRRSYACRSRWSPYH